MLHVEDCHTETRFDGRDDARGAFALDNDRVVVACLAKEPLCDRSIEPARAKRNQWDRTVFFEGKIWRSEPTKSIVAKDDIVLLDLVREHLNECQVEFAGSQPRPDDAAQSDARVHPDKRMLDAEPADDVGDLIDLRFIVTAQSDRSRQFSKLQTCDCFVMCGQNLLRMSEQLVTHLCWLDRLAITHEQCVTKALFEPLNLPTHGGLGQMQARGGARKAPGFDDRSQGP